MSTSGPDDTPPPSELQGLDPKDLLQAGLETVPPVTLPPQPVDSDATIPVARPQSTQPSPQVELPLPEELTQLLPTGAYHVESFLGQGGMGAVYKGMQVRLKRPVAIKIMRRDMGKDYDFEARFEREAQAMAKLNHPNIVSVIDFGEAGANYLYIVMELIDGADLMDVIRGGQMTQEMALTLLPQVCDALQFAHDHGIVHRDIKPSNIMLTRDGRVKMCDFGLAKRYDVESSFRTQTGTGMGTPDYAAPEQFDPKANIDHRADIYALGVMIYQMITGQLPRGVWKPPSQRAEISPQWDDIVSRAMQSDPSDRYQQASEVKTDVSSIPMKAAAPSPNLSLKGEGEGKAARAVKSDPSPLGGERLGEGSVLRSNKSRAPLVIGIITAAAVIVAGAFFALRDTAPRSGGLQPPSQTASITPGSSPTPSSAPQTPTPAVQNTPLLAPPLPESGWKPLVTDAVWRAVSPDREFADGLLHIRRNTAGSGIIMPQSTVDAAIRARIRIRNGTSGPMIQLRQVTDKGRYMVGLYRPADGGYHVSLLRRTEGGKQEALGTYPLPQQPREGDTLALELRAQEDRLTVLVDGIVRIEANDKAIREAGNWGIQANEAWFESVEVQPLPAAVSPQWNDALAAWWQGGTQREGWVREKDGSARLTAPGPIGIHLGKIGTTTPPIFGAQAVRARFRLGDSPYLTLGVCRSLQAEMQARGYYAAFATGKSSITLTLDSPGMASYAELAAVPLPKGVDRAATHTMELRYANHLLTLILDGQALYEKPHKQYMQGYPVLHTRQGAIVESLEVADLGSGAVSPSPAPQVSKSSPAFPPGQWVKLFTKPEDLPAHLRKPDSGVKWEDGWIRVTPSAKALTLPSDLSGNYGVRFRAIRAVVRTDMALRWQKSGNTAEKGAYSIQINNDELRLLRLEQDNYFLIQGGRIVEPPVIGSEYGFEYGVVGDRLVGRVGGNRALVVRDERWAQGPGYLSATEDLRDIEVINLDGLPEAEALHLLGVDEQGNDLRGKAGANTGSTATTPSPVWLDALAEAPLKGVIATADHTDKGYLLPSGNHWQFPAQPVLAGAIRVVAVTEAGSPNHLSLNFGIKDFRDQYQVMLNRKLDQCVLTYQKEGKPDKILAVKEGVHLADGQPYELLLARMAGQFHVLLNGQMILQTAEPDPTPRYLTLNCFGDARARVQKVEYLNLDGLPEAEALRLLGVDEKGNDLRGKTEAASAVEAWQDVLHDPAKLTLAGGNVKRTSEGLIFSNSGTARIRGKGAPQHDGAIRLRTTLGGLQAVLRGREGNAGFYFLQIVEGNGKVSLNRWESGARQGTNLRGFPLHERLQSGQEYEVELRIVGQTLTAAFNGEILGTVTDGAFTEGEFGVAVNDRDGKPVQVKALEYLDLDGSSTVSPSPSLPVSKSSVATATKDAPLTNTLGMKFVPVPITGGPTDKQRVLFSVWETRVQDYEAFVKDTKRECPKPDFEQGPTHPAVNVSWDDATAFCAWLTDRERKAGTISAKEVYRLPSDHEWSCAAGIGGQEDATKTPEEKKLKIQDVFPWGSHWPPLGNAENYWSEELRPSLSIPKFRQFNGELTGYRDGFAFTAPVGTYSANPFGLHDLGGNVREICQDWWNREQTGRVARGACWSLGTKFSLAWSSRAEGTEGFRRGLEYGFRIVFAPVTATP